MTERKSRFPVKLFMLAALCGAAYIHGIRIVDISETPSSRRPWGIVLNGQLGSAEIGYSKDDRDFLSKIVP